MLYVWKFGDLFSPEMVWIKNCWDPKTSIQEKPLLVPYLSLVWEMGYEVNFDTLLWIFWRGGLGGGGLAVYEMTWFRRYELKGLNSWQIMVKNSGCLGL